jgi:hypothetical protein
MYKKPAVRNAVAMLKSVAKKALMDGVVLGYFFGGG